MGAYDDAFHCSVHHTPMLITQSGLQRVCDDIDCEEYVRLQGPLKEDPVVKKAELSKEERAKAIAEFAAKKKDATTAKGPVIPAKKPSTKIPASANMTGDKTPAKAADDELDKSVEKATKKEKKEKDPNMLSVSDVARELGVEPKVARAKLRRDGSRAPDGRWPLVKRGSKDHDRLIALLAEDDTKEADEADAKAS